MNRRLLALAAVLLTIVLPVGAEYFIIDHYGIDVEVMENNAYLITETIDVTFNQERHGIYRDIPASFDGRRVKISDIRVPGWKKKVERSSDEVNIRIGDADVWVDGSQTYIISYTYDVGADDLPDMDEFNHNLIGLWWETDILAADFSITMPADFNASELNFTSGDYGSTDNSGVAWTVDGRRITGSITRPLGPNQGLTASLPLPEGYWVGAVVHREPGHRLFTVLGYPLFILALLASFLIWRKHGKDNKLFPSVEFHPPEGMNPAEIGYIIDGSVDSKDVTSLIVYWAQQGCLDIEEELVERKLLKDRELLVLVKKTELPDTAHSYEKTLFHKLFSYGSDGRVTPDDLENKLYSAVSKAKQKIRESFTKNRDRAIYRKGGARWTALAFLFAALPVMSVMVQLFSAFTGSIGAGLLGLPFSLFLVIPSIMLGSALAERGESAKAKIIFALVFGGFSFLFFGVFLVFLEGAVPVVKYLAAVASGIGSGVFVAIMKRRTEFGDRMLELTLGFREFIREAEKDKLEELFDSNPAYFYDILPYAMVLGLTDKWAGHFNDMTVEPPDWYRGYRREGFRTAVFASTMQTNFNTISSSMTSSPSSGSSGSSSSGGFSGGGSGGGGGGSW